MPSFRNQSWPDDMTRKLKQLADEGLTARKIAEHLKVTRCAVLGKADRMGLRIRRDLAPSPLRPEPLTPVARLPTLPFVRCLKHISFKTFVMMQHNEV